jgi:Ethanolamine utilization protein EutJ (predicted chaperonin)
VSNYTADFQSAVGIFDGNVTFPPGVINSKSHVLVSICEIITPEPSSGIGTPFKGQAVLTLHNVVPFDTGNVEITIDTGWGSPIGVRMFFSVDPA